jgi:hypothetical protein
MRPEGVDRPHQDLRIDAAASDFEAELLCDGFDLQGDDARDVQALERTEREDVVDPRQYLGRELGVGEGRLR